MGYKGQSSLDTLIINAIGREKRYAVLKDGQLEKIVIEQPKQQSLVGNIYFGIVQKVLPGMNAAFVDIGLEKNGYLHRDKLATSKDEGEIRNLLHEGQRIIVQIEKDATGGKGPRLTEIIELNGDFLVYMPRGNYIAISKKIEDQKIREKWRQFANIVKGEKEGLLFRTACQEATEERVLAELNELKNQYKALFTKFQQMKKPGLLLEKNSFVNEIKKELGKMTAGKVVVDKRDLKEELERENKNERVEIIQILERQGIFSLYRIEQEIEKALRRIVWLDNGAYLIFDEAEALTFIDVNTGKYSGKNNLEDTVLKTNELAATEIARQIRLRNLAGMILIDFIDMKSDEERNYIRHILGKALEKDDHRTKIIGFTPLGILQLTRKKTSVAIFEALTENCSVCHGRGRVFSKETVAFQLERELLEMTDFPGEAVLIETTKEVKDIFVGVNQQDQLRLEQLLGIKIFFFIQEKEYPYYSIKQFGSLEEIQDKLL